MGSSDEEEMRRVRTARGFQTRVERAAAARAERTTAGRRTAATTGHAAAEADAAAAAALRRAARRATAEDGGSSSSSEDDHSLRRGPRRAAAAAAWAAEAAGRKQVNGAGVSVHVPEDNNAQSGEHITLSSSTDLKRRSTLGEESGSGRLTTAAKLHHGVERPMVSLEFQKPARPPSPGAGESSSDEDDCPGPRPLAMAHSPSSEDAEFVDREAECPNSSGTDDMSGSSSNRSSSRNSNGIEKVPRNGASGGSSQRRTSMSETAASDAAAEAATEARAASFLWQWRRETRPAGGSIGTNTDNEDSERSDADGKEEIGGGSGQEDDDDDFLFDQVPEEDTSTVGCATPAQPARQVEKLSPPELQLRPQQPHASELVRGGQLEDEKQEKEKKEERKQLLEQRKDQQDGKQQPSRQQEQPKHESEQHSEKRKQPLQKRRDERRGEGSKGGLLSEEEEEEGDYDIEEERRELGLPLAFGCGAGAAAADGSAARNAYIRRLTREGGSNSSGSSDASSRGLHRSLAEGGSSSTGAAADEDDDEAVKWRTLGLPVSLEVDIPAHSPAQVSAFAVNLKANRMATGGSDGFVRLWDFQGLHLEHLRSYRSFSPAEKHKVEALAFSFRNDLLLVAAGDAVCRVYTAQAAELVHTTTRGDMYIRDAANTKGHTHTVLDCCWHPLQAQQFFSCGLDATIRLWDLNAKPYGILQTLPHVTCFKTVPSAMCGSGRGAAGNALRSSSSDCCTCCVVAPTAADCLVAGCADGSLQLWGSLSSRKVFGRPDAIVRDAHSVSPLPASLAGEATGSGAAASLSASAASSPASRLCVVGGLRKTAELKHRAGVPVGDAAPARRATAAAVGLGAQPSTENVSGKGHGVSAVHFFSDDRRLVTRGEDGSVAVWDIRNFKQPVARATLLPSNSNDGRGGLCLSPDEKYVCVTTQGGNSLTSGDASAASAAGAVHVLSADALSLVTALPITAATSSVSSGSGTCSGPAAAPSTGGEGTRIPRGGATVQVKEESEKDSVGSDRDGSTSGSRTTGRRQVRQPLRVLWPSETNQLLVSCTDGCVCVLFDRQMSRKGVLLCVDAAKGSRRRQVAEQELGIMYTQPYILVPGQLPEGFKETRDGQIIRVKPRGRERQRLFLEKQKTLIPPIPAKEGYAGANVGGGNRSQHLLRQLGLLDPPAAPGEDDDDPVAALRAYAEKVESSGRESQLISRAYAATQPHAVLEFDAEEEEAALAAGVASGAVEDSGRLLQQKTRCPRCALRMCQCGYIDEQNAAANARSTKRQRV